MFLRVATLQLLLVVFRTPGAWVLAQPANAPAPGGLLASAPAPGTPGDYTATSGLYTITLSPNVMVGSFADQAQSYFSGANGSLASAGYTSVYNGQTGLITAQISNPPSPLNGTLAAQAYILSDPFGGAACVSYSFVSSASSAIVGIADADQFLDNNYPALPSSIPYTICGGTNCTSSSTYALNASAGHYYFNITNPSSSRASVVLSYMLYSANSSACQGLSTANQVPTPYTQTTPALVTPPLRSTAIIAYDTLPDSGTTALEATVRNTSCVTALLSVNATTSSGRLTTPAYLLLLDQHGMEDLLNPAVPLVTPTGGCQAGISATSCAFTSSGLVPGQAYHLWVFYVGNASAYGLYEDALVTATFATSTSAGSCSNLISTNATNGGFKGYVTFEDASSTSSAPVPAPASLSSPSVAPTPSAPSSSSVALSPASTSSSSSLSPSSSSSGASSGNTPASLGSGVFVPNG